jgi:DNA-binding response OmpR family regulator
MKSLKGRILCTKDDEDTRDLTFVLRDHGFEVIGTQSADEALNLAKTQYFDLYLVDNWMPGLSGIELCKKLREFDVKRPILFDSAAAYETDRENARLHGAQGYLVKPVDSDELVTEIFRLIAESKIAKPIRGM